MGPAEELGSLGLNGCPAVEVSDVTVHQEFVCTPIFTSNQVTGKTKGIMRWEGGETRIMSAQRGPAASFGGRGSGFDSYVKTHVEGHTAAFMRQRGLSNAELLISRNPCSSCENLLYKMLPEGSTLTVIGPEGEVWLFIGGVP